MTVSKKAKYYVLDTNILLSDPYSIYGFEDNVVVITGTVLQELDTKKTLIGDTGFNARESVRILEELRLKGNLNDGVQLNKKGMLIVEPDGVDERRLPKGYSIDRPDNRIISTCIYLQEQLKLNNIFNKVVLVSNDISMRINASVCGVIAEAYRNDRIESDDKIYMGRRDLETPYGIIDTIYQNGYVDISTLDLNDSFIENEFVTLKEGRKSALSIFRNNKFELIKEPTACNVKCLNAVQKYALYALLAPVEEIPLVILKGEAGTAKTFLSLAAALEKVYLHTKDKPEYQRVLITRNNVTADKEFGALPGELEDKMNPLIMPFLDNLVQLIDCANMKNKVNNAPLKTQDLFDNGVIELCPLAYIRGRSLANSFLIVDECQNSTRSQMRDIVTRAGKNTKVVICGDPKQIDNPVLDRWNNGLAFVSDNFKGSKKCAQITFTERECVRSELATEALKLLVL